MIKSFCGIENIHRIYAACTHAIIRSLCASVTRTPTINFPFDSMCVLLCIAHSTSNRHSMPDSICVDYDSRFGIFTTIHARSLSLSLPFSHCRLHDVSIVNRPHTYVLIAVHSTTTDCRPTGLHAHTNRIPVNTLTVNAKEREVRLFLGFSHYYFHSVELKPLNASDVFNRLYTRARINKPIHTYRFPY